MNVLLSAGPHDMEAEHKAGAKKPCEQLRNFKQTLPIVPKLQKSAPAKPSSSLLADDNGGVGGRTWSKLDCFQNTYAM